MDMSKKKIKKYRWIFFHKYLLSENYSKFIGMLKKTLKNNKISNNIFDIMVTRLRTFFSEKFLDSIT